MFAEAKEQWTLTFWMEQDRCTEGLRTQEVRNPYPLALHVPPSLTRSQTQGADARKEREKQGPRGAKYWIYKTIQ